MNLEKFKTESWNVIMYTFIFYVVQSLFIFVSYFSRFSSTQRRWNIKSNPFLSAVLDFKILKLSWHLGVVLAVVSSPVGGPVCGPAEKNRQESNGGCCNLYPGNLTVLSQPVETLFTQLCKVSLPQSSAMHQLLKLERKNELVLKKQTLCNNAMFHTHKHYPKEKLSKEDNMNSILAGCVHCKVEEIVVIQSFTNVQDENPAVFF